MIVLDGGGREVDDKQVSLTCKCPITKCMD